MPTPQETPYNKVNIVDAGGNLVSFGANSGDSPTATKQQEISDRIGNADINGATLPAGGSGLRGWLSAIWKLLSDRIPTPINNRIPVDIASLNVTVANTQLEISNDTGNPVPVNGTVAVANFPATQSIVGNVAIANFPATQTVSGNVSIANFPTTQPVSGNVSINNAVANPVPVSGNVSITNFPATQAVSGNVSINNTTTNPVPISGTVVLASGTSSLATTADIQSVRDRLPDSLISNRLSTQPNFSNQYWREEFSGVALPTGWNAIQIGAGQSIVVSNSELQILTGTTTNSETIIERNLNLRSDTRISLQILFRLGNRSNNQEIIFELSDSANANFVQVVFSGTNSTNSSINTSCGGIQSGSQNFQINDTFFYNILQIEIKNTGIEICSILVNNNNNAIFPVVRNQKIPDSTSIPSLKLRIRTRNLATAPNANTVFIDAISLSETQKILADISSGFGGGNLANSLPVNVINFTPTLIVSANNIVTNNAESIFALGANGTFSGSTRDMNRQRIFSFACNSDQSGTLFFEQSPDNSNWFVASSYSVIAGTPLFRSEQTQLRYCRLRYVNGATAQTSFRLYSTQFSF